jgi:DNA-directed RNA polymerase subunit RPC12/RpoP
MAGAPRDSWLECALCGCPVAAGTPPAVPLRCPACGGRIFQAVLPGIERRKER